MSGIEVAGIVLAVIPIVVESLKSASKGKVLSRRQKHVDALIHALVIQEASLSLTVKALFAKSGVTGFSEDWRALTALLKERKDIRELVEGFLEPEVFSVYTYSLGQCDKAVRDIAERIGGICGGDIAKGAPNLEELLIFNSRRPSEAHPWSSLKLLLRKEEINIAIQDLDKNIASLGRLQQLVEARHEVAMTTGFPTNPNAKQLAKSLSQARNYAVGLYNAISQAWSPTCSRKHHTKLFLESRLGTKQRSHIIRKQRAQPVQFEIMIHCTSDTVPAFVWHENSIEVIEKDENEQPHFPEGPSISKIRFTGVQSSPVQPHSLADVVDLCDLIHQVSLEQKLLQLYLFQQAKMLYRQTRVSSGEGMRSDRLVTLAQLLADTSGDSRKRIPLRDRMMLALNLASNVLQLHTTAWLNESWSRSNIFFLGKAGTVPLHGSSSAADFDTTKPFIMQNFRRGRSPAPAPPTPKRALQELAIVLLELWHEISLESQFLLISQPSPAERLYLAMEWLDDQFYPPPDNYRQAVSQCLHPHFSTVNGILDWGDLQFQQAICQFVVDPLVRSCAQWSCF